MLKTIHALLQQLALRSNMIAAMGLTTKLADGDLRGRLINLANRPEDLDRISRAIECLVTKAGLTPALAEQALRQLVNDRHFYGTYCELGAYEWLDRNGAAFTAQIALTGQQVLNPNGCIIDGRFDEVEAFFDIKGFGFQAYAMELFKERLKALLPGFDVVIDGPTDIAVKDIETYAFGRLNSFRASLATGGIEQIKELGWTVRVHAPRRVTMAEHTQDPYRLAEENRYYPFKTAGQFTTQAPFVLIFPYAAQFNTWHAVNFAGGADIAMRSIARRAFFQLTGDHSLVQKHDDQTSPGTLVSDAARLLSGILFLDLDRSEGWLFLNPRAAHPLTNYSLEEIFNFHVPVGLGVDDFAHDAY
jgi:hypothetical protein